MWPVKGQGISGYPGLIWIDNILQIKGGAYKVEKWIVPEKIVLPSSKYSTDEENFSQNDEVIEPFDDDHDHSDAESKSEGKEIGKFVDLRNDKTISRVF